MSHNEMNEEEGEMAAFSDMDEFIISSAGEMKNLLNQVTQAHCSCHVTIYNRHRSKQILSFTSYLFLTDKKELEFESMLLMDRAVVAQLEKSNIVRVQAFLDGVKVVCEGLLQSWGHSSTGSVWNVSFPYKMLRYQRRDSFRVKVPYTYPMMLDLEKSNPLLMGLKPLNISNGGIAVVAYIPEKLIDLDKIFDKAVLHLPQTSHDSFTLQMMVKHKKSIDKNYLASHVSTKSTAYPPFQLGLQFGRLPHAMSNVLMKIINELTIRNR